MLCAKASEAEGEIITHAAELLPEAGLGYLYHTASQREDNRYKQNQQQPGDGFSARSLGGRQTGFSLIWSVFLLCKKMWHKGFYDAYFTDTGLPVARKSITVAGAKGVPLYTNLSTYRYSTYSIVSESTCWAIMALANFNPFDYR